MNEDFKAFWRKAVERYWWVGYPIALLLASYGMGYSGVAWACFSLVTKIGIIDQDAHIKQLTEEKKELTRARFYMCITTIVCSLLAEVLATVITGIELYSMLK